MQKVKALVGRVLVGAGLIAFASGCMSDGSYVRQPDQVYAVDPHYGREYEKTFESIGVLGATLGRQQSPAKQQQAIQGMGALGSIFDMFSR